jgi:hypothetical protein
MLAIQQAVSAINLSQKVPNFEDLGAYIVSDFFTPDLLDQTKYLFKQARTQTQRWHPVPGQELQPRVSFYDLGDAFSMWVNDLFGHPELIKVLEEKIGYPVIHNGVDFWVDGPGYVIPPHFDAGEYHNSIQIYVLLSDSTAELGTTVYDKNQKELFSIPYSDNCGYFFTNTHQTLHGMLKPVPPGMIRCSVFSRYKPNITS